MDGLLFWNQMVFAWGKWNKSINSLDYSLMNSHFLQNFSSADINKDGLVNSLDYAILKNNYGKSGQ